MDVILKIFKLVEYIFYSSREGYWRYFYFFFKVVLLIDWFFWEIDFEIEFNM